MAEAAEPPAKRMREGSAEEPVAEKPVPITLLSGFLGAGKTTMLKHLLENKEGLKVGIVVNDVAEINIDAALVAVRGGGNAAADDTVEMQNGCACCSSAEELLQSIVKLMKLSRDRDTPWDHIVIEASGVAEPREIRDNFRNCYNDMPEMLEGTVLHTLVTVVDGSTFLTEFEKRSGPQNKVSARPELGQNDYTDGGRQVVDLMCEQIECADVLVVNKMDLVKSSAELALLKETLGNLNRTAKLFTSERGRVQLSDILGAAQDGGIAMLDEDQEHRRMVEEISKQEHAHGHDEVASSHDHGHAESHHDHSHAESHGHGHAHCGDECEDKSATQAHAHDHAHAQDPKVQASRESTRFGITSFCYQRRRPFHPHRLMNVIRQLPVRREQLALSEALEQHSEEPAAAGAETSTPDGASPMCSLIRSKGFLWLSNSHSQIFYWALAGKHFELKQYATWWQSLPEEEWPTDEKEVAEIRKDYDGEFGDHRQEIVMIGVKMDRAAIVKLLDECLLSDQEMVAYRQHWLS